MVLLMNEVNNGSLIVIDGQPYAVLTVEHSHIGRGGSNVTARIKNLVTGKVLERTFKPSDEFEEADVKKIKSVFIYESRGAYWFTEAGKPQNRFSLTKENLGEVVRFLKPNLDVLAIKFSVSGGDPKIIAIELPIKVDYIVKEAPLAVRGNTAQGGTKTIVLETGAEIQTPLFIGEGDVVRVNTQTGEYAERVAKA